MRLGKRARYTLRLMMGIGRAEAEGKPISLKAVSESSGISRRYLDQLTIALKNAALIEGRSGRGGGYTLARPASQILIGEILRAATGPISIADCVTKPESCINSEFCSCRMLFELLHRRIKTVLDDYSLQDMLEGQGAERLEREIQSMGEDSNSLMVSPGGLP